MRIETSRLILRAPRREDTESYLQLHNSEFVLRYNAMDKTTSERVWRRFDRPDEGVLLLTDKQTGQVMGEVCIEEDSLRYGVASRELAYWLGEAFSRQGYMKEALHGVISYLFEKEQLVCVSARCFAENRASLALLKSLGFRQDGYIPQCVKGYGGKIFDDTLHSLFREDFV